jgi:hypothetical protein
MKEKPKTVYEAYDLEGKIFEVTQESGASLSDVSKFHCPRCGARIIDLGLNCCVVCSMFLSRNSIAEYSDEKEIAAISKEIFQLTERLKTQTDLLETILGVNDVRKKNLAM